VNVLDFRVNGVWFVQIPIVCPRVARTDSNSQAVGLLIEHEGQRLRPVAIQVCLRSLPDREFEFRFAVLKGTHALPPLFLAAQFLQTNSIDRGESGVKHADPLLRSVTGMPPSQHLCRRTWRCQ
jgi:hypothetical protein